MTLAARKIVWTVAAAACLVAVASLAPGPAAQDAGHTAVTVRGKLIDAAAQSPMAGAVVRFSSTGESGGWAEATTGRNGEFVLEGLSFGDYVVEITTSEGEKIRGINSLSLARERIRVTLNVSEQVASNTTPGNEPTRFAAVTEVQKVDWKRFWKEFGIFFGVAIGAGAAAL